MVKIREFVRDDLPLLVKLLNETYKDWYEFIPYSESTLVSEVNKRSSKILVAQENGEVKGFAAYIKGQWGEEIEWLCVKPVADQGELEDLLVRKIEKYVESGEVFTVLDVDSPKIENWNRRGYAIEGGLYHMVAELNNPQPIPPVLKNIIIRSLKPGEEPKMMETVNTGYGWERLSSNFLKKWKSHDPLFNEDWVHVAESDGKIISIVVSRRDIEYNKHFNAKRGYLGPAVTLAKYRGKGLATALTRRAMNFLLTKQMKSCALYTSEKNTASVTLLKRLNFEIKHHWKFLYKHFEEDKENTRARK